MSFRVITSPVKLKVGEMDFLPEVRYVVPAGIASRINYALVVKQISFRQSSFNPFLRPYGGADLNGKRLAVFRHSAFGDQLMTTSVVGYLKNKYPRASIDVYCAPNVLNIWDGLPVAAIAAPMRFETLVGYDWHLLFDQMLEENREPDQACAYDDLFAFAGQRDVPNAWKQPWIAGHNGDYSDKVVFDFTLRRPKRPYLVYQYGAANHNRSYPFDQADAFLRLFKREFPDWDVVVVGKMAKGASWVNLANADLDLVNQVEDFRSLIPLVRGAGLVVCPDSSIGHLAAVFPHVPVISLWGLFAPEDRAKYYPNHHPLWPRTVCPHAPCHNHDATLPQALCSAATNATEGEQKWCNVLRAITPQMIFEKAKEILRK